MLGAVIGQEKVEANITCCFIMMVMTEEKDAHVVQCYMLFFVFLFGIM